MTAKPYVGITGSVSVQETRDICKEFSEAGYSMESPHIPMLGFLVSYKTLNGQATQNRRYPTAISLPDLLKATDGQVLTMVHYNSKEMETLAEQVSQIFDGVYDDLCKAIQLNIVWPNVNQVGKIMDRFPDMKIVFQASHKAMAGKTPLELAREIVEYGDTISYVLIDFFPLYENDEDLPFSNFPEYIGGLITVEDSVSEEFDSAFTPSIYKLTSGRLLITYQIGHKLLLREGDKISVRAHKVRLTGNSAHLDDIAYLIRLGDKWEDPTADKRFSKDGT
ncbi:MAG: hypothetical protein KJ771_08140 [Nanoarchaeota archaeon]|nr:hypothetical protein [Nanoarchaeota archaeon]